MPPSIREIWTSRADYPPGWLARLNSPWVDGVPLVGGVIILLLIVLDAVGVF
jgi:hypothetical protein